MMVTDGARRKAEKSPWHTAANLLDARWPASFATKLALHATHWQELIKTCIRGKKPASGPVVMISMRQDHCAVGKA
jgi:hypothetical protein